MNRLHKYLIIVFCLGVFLCGIGAGVAFTEFSALTYGGEQYLGTSDIKTKNFDVKFEPGEKKSSIRIAYPSNAGIVQVDNSIPENTVRFCVKYNAECVEPFAYWDEEAGRIDLSYYWIDDDSDVALVLEAKDVFLQNLKEGKLVSFRRHEYEEVTVWVNEKNMDDVYMWY